MHTFEGIRKQKSRCLLQSQTPAPHFLYVSEGSKDLRSERVAFFAAETVRAVIIARKIIKRIGCKKIHHLVLHICCSPL